MLDLSRRKGQKGYPNIEVVYANDDTEAACLMQGYARRGYLYQNPASAGCEPPGGRDWMNGIIMMRTVISVRERLVKLHMRQPVQQRVRGRKSDVRTSFSPAESGKRETGDCDQGQSGSV